MRRSKKPQPSRRAKGESAKGKGAEKEPLWPVHLLIWGIVVAGLLIIIIAAWQRNRLATERSLDERLSRWERKYELTRDQAARIREIELAFHGRSNLIWITRYTKEELELHNSEIAASMRPAFAERFLKAEEAHRK